LTTNLYLSDSSMSVISNMVALASLTKQEEIPLGQNLVSKD
jgi:hypothetical protein